MLRRGFRTPLSAFLPRGSNGVLSLQGQLPRCQGLYIYTMYASIYAVTTTSTATLLRPLDMSLESRVRRVCRGNLPQGLCHRATVAKRTRGVRYTLCVETVLRNQNHPINFFHTVVAIELDHGITMLKQ